MHPNALFNSALFCCLHTVPENAKAISHLCSTCCDRLLFCSTQSLRDHTSFTILFSCVFREFSVVSYFSLKDTVCDFCGHIILGSALQALDKKYHPEHFVCFQCKLPLSGGFFPHQGKPYCRQVGSYLLIKTQNSCHRKECHVYILIMIDIY